MQKTDTFFVISNFNTFPDRYLKYCNDYIIYDQSTDEAVISKLKVTNWNIVFSDHTGTSLSDNFKFMIDYYDNLPPLIMLLKGNMIDRHVSEEYFNRIYNNKYFTPIFDSYEKQHLGLFSFQLFEGAYLEPNNNWYVKAKPYKYFETYNELLDFIFIKPIIPKWLYFSPGNCYIVTNEQIRKYPKSFWKALKYLASYKFYPSEAYHIERMLYIIYNCSYELQPYMYDYEIFLDKLEENLKNFSSKKELRKNIFNLNDFFLLGKSILKYILYRYR